MRSRCWRAAAAAGLLALLAACSNLPQRPALAPEQALAPAKTGGLAQALAPAVAERAPRSGFLPLESGLDAFAARLWLVDRATTSLDVQCYIWRPDRTGRWLLARMQAAADRGVRVRLLLDDNNGSAELDQLLQRLDAHERIEVRLFNPYPRTGPGRPLALLTDFSRLNRRMHNKAFIADGLAAIIGGRNSGDEYFGVDDEMQFADLDALMVGPVMPAVVKSFDDYWNNVSAYPLATLLDARLLAAVTEPERRAALDAERYATGLIGQPRAERWRAGGPRPADFAWGRAELFVDPPGKILKQAAPEALMLAQMRPVLVKAERSIDLVSPYFVPSQAGIDAMTELQRKGVRLRVLTNSLAATDVAAVHAGYADRRMALLDAGVELYELKPTPPPGAESGGRQRSPRLLGYDSASEASLHAKTFAVDNERVFIGSFNFDQRSIWLNTEIGAVIEHPGLARRLARAFETEVPRNSWRVSREGDALRWTEQTDAGPRVLTSEPETGWALRTWVWFLSLLPIDGLL